MRATNRLTLDEIVQLVDGIARDPGAGADRFRAIRWLAQQSAATAALPAPANEQEIVERLARLQRCAGAERTRIAYRLAFPALGDVDAPVEAAAMRRHLPGELVERAKACSTVRRLYRAIPALKRPGRPPGYPIRGDALARRRWCQEQALSWFTSLSR